MHQPPRAFLWYLGSVGSWFSSFGMQTIAFPWLVTVVLHESPARLGVAQMSLMAPSILFMLLLGMVIARGWLAYGGLVAYALAVGTIGAFVMPARDAMLTRVAEGYGRAENPQVRDMQAMVGERRSGGNLVLVSHGSTIPALTGVSLDSGEMVVLTPQGAGRFVVIGRLRARGT